MICNKSKEQTITKENIKNDARKTTFILIHVYFFKNLKHKIQLTFVTFVYALKLKQDNVLTDPNRKICQAPLVGQNYSFDRISAA